MTAYLNDYVKERYHTSDKEYLAWCEKHKKSAYSTETKQDYVERLADGRLVHDEHNQLVTKRKRR